MNKNEVVKTLLVLWFAGTTFYVISDIWNSYKTKGIKQAYQQGITDTINGIAKQAGESQCQPFEIGDGKQSVKLVAAECLSVSTSQETEK